MSAYGGSQPQVRPQTLCATCTANGENQIAAAAPAGYEYVIYNFNIQLEGATTTLVRLKGDSYKRRRQLNQFDSIGAHFAPGRELHMGAASPIIIELDGANLCNYHFDITTEPV